MLWGKASHNQSGDFFSCSAGSRPRTRSFYRGPPSNEYDHHSIHYEHEQRLQYEWHNCLPPRQRREYDQWRGNCRYGPLVYQDSQCFEVVAERETKRVFSHFMCRFDVRVVFKVWIRVVVEDCIVLGRLRHIALKSNQDFQHPAFDQGGEQG